MVRGQNLVDATSNEGNCNCWRNQSCDMCCAVKSVHCSNSCTLTILNWKWVTCTTLWQLILPTNFIICTAAGFAFRNFDICNLCSLVSVIADMAEVVMAHTLWWCCSGTTPSVERCSAVYWAASTAVFTGFCSHAVHIIMLLFRNFDAELIACFFTFLISSFNCSLKSDRARQNPHPSSVVSSCLCWYIFFKNKNVHCLAIIYRLK